MEIIYGGRGSGKTTKLIQESATTGAVIVCHSQWYIGTILDMAKRSKLEIPVPITYQDLISQRWLGKKIGSFLIDDVDMFIEYVALKPVKICTFSRPPKITRLKIDNEFLEEDLQNLINGSILPKNQKSGN